MKIYVTGQSGFVGRALLPMLKNSGHEVVSSIDRADAAIHLAGIAHRRASSSDLQEANVRLTQRLAEQAAGVGAHFVFLSSVKVHGEFSQTALRESSPIAPRDAYAASKARAEDELGRINGLRYSVLRSPLVYGPFVKANFLALMGAIARGWPLPLATINNLRSLLYVGNLVDAIIYCLASIGTFLVADGEPVSTPDLCREIGGALGIRARLMPFPPACLPRKLAGSLVVDDSAIRALGWRPPYSRQEGLKATADWYLAR